MGQIMTAEEIRKLYEEIAVQEEKEKEIQALSEPPTTEVTGF